MAPLYQLVYDEWRADAMKEDTCLSRINLLREQFAEAAHQKGIDVLTPPTHRDIGTDVNETSDDGMYGKQYNNHDEVFSYHSSDGSTKEEAAAHGGPRCSWNVAYGYLRK
jgi:hypothetical protein